MDSRTKPVVAILAMPESSSSVLYGMYDLFSSAGRDWSMATGGAEGPGVVRPVIVGTRPGSFAILNGVQVSPETTIAEIGYPDVVCVPDLAVDPYGPLDDGRFAPEIAWLRDCYARGVVLASACSGALLFAEAGLLDGHDATTHWAFADALARRHPRVRLHPERSLVVSGADRRLVMAGGGTAWSDLALYLISRLSGAEQAMQTARMNLIEWHAVGQQPFASLARSRQAEDALIARCQAWIALNYDAPAPVAAMVRESGLPERTFKRRFQLATGLSPLDYVHTLRIEEAKQMLEAGDASAESIAHEVGYEDAGFFGRLFRRKVGLTPAQYRRRFGTMRRSLAQPG